MTVPESDDDACFTCFIINTTHKPPSHPNFPTMQAYDCYGYPYYPHYPDYGTATRGSTNIYTTHSSSSESDTIPLGYDESGYEHFHRSIFDGLLICSNSYGPGDGFVYFIRSASGKSRLRRLGLTHMSDAWKEYMLAHYESKRPDRKPRGRRRPQQVVDQG